MNNINVSGQHIAEISLVLCMYQSDVLVLKKDADDGKQESEWDLKVDGMFRWQSDAVKP